MFNTYYSVKTQYTNSFDNARFNLVWRFNYVLTLLFVVLNLVYIIQGDFNSILSFTIAIIITFGSLVYLYKTNNYKTIYFFIATCGILMPALGMNYIMHQVHYGDIVWLIVAAALAYFGLGSNAGKYYALAGISAVAIHIIFFFNSNLAQVKPLNTLDKIVLALELSIALSIIFYIIYQYTSLYSQSEKNVLSINSELKKQNEEKELLLKEIHHRVKNNLQIVSSLLNLQSNSIDNEFAVTAIKEGQSRIKSMALLHQKLYQNSADYVKLDFNSYVSDLVESIDKANKNKEQIVKINIEVKNIYFDIDTAVPLGLIINELCTNCYKYAFKNGGVLLVAIEETASNNYKLTIKDSGLGLPNNINIENSKTLGLKLVTMLTKQLRGKLEYYFDNGAIFILSFTDKAKDNA